MQMSDLFSPKNSDSLFDFHRIVVDFWYFFLFLTGKKSLKYLDFSLSLEATTK